MRPRMAKSPDPAPGKRPRSAHSDAIACWRARTQRLVGLGFRNENRFEVTVQARPFGLAAR